LDQLQAATTSFAGRFIPDALVRDQYRKEAFETTWKIRQEVMADRLSPEEGAQLASRRHNAGRSS
jgi:hypothetical protein